MGRSKKILNSLLLSCAFASAGIGGFLTESQIAKTPIVAHADDSSQYEQISNNLPGYFNRSSLNAGNVDNDIFLFSQNDSYASIEIGKNEIEGEGKDKDGKDIKVKNYCYFPEEGNSSSYYLFKFSNALSLFRDLTNDDLANGDTDNNLLQGQPISKFVKTYTSKEGTSSGGIPKALSFTPEKLEVKFKLDTSADNISISNNGEITLNKEGCYTLSVPTVVYKTTNNGESFVSSEEITNFTFMIFKTATYFNTTTRLPNLTSSSNIQVSAVQGASDYSQYYFHSYSANKDEDGYTLPTLSYDSNVYQLTITYTDTDENILTSRIEYSNGNFTQYNKTGQIIEEKDYFVYPVADENTTQLVFNDLGTYDIEISYLYKINRNGEDKIYTIALQNLQNETFKNKKQKLFIYGSQAMYSNYDEIDEMTNQPVSSELKTLDTQNAKFSLNADITMGVNKQCEETLSNPTHDTTDLTTDTLKGKALDYINNSYKTPITTNQTPIRFVSNVNVDTEKSGLYKLTKNNAGEWEAEAQTFSLLNQNTAGVYLYIIRYTYPQFTNTNGSLLSNAYHYQIFFFEVTNIAPTVSLYEVEKDDQNNENVKTTELYTRGFTNKGVYVLDDSRKNPYDAKVSITLTAYDYTYNRNLFTNLPIENFAENSLYNIKYQTFENINDTVNGKSGLFIPNSCNAKFTVNIKAKNAQSPSVSTFTIDNNEIKNINARKVEIATSSNYSIGEELTQNITNESVVFSWDEKPSGATTYGYLKYIPIETKNYYDESSSISSLLYTLISDHNMLPINYSFDLENFKNSTWVEYGNTGKYTDLVNASYVKQNNGFYLLEVFDSAGNIGFEIFLIDKTNPLFVKNQIELDENGEEGISTRTLISNGENIDVPEDANYKVYIEWAKYKGFMLEHLSSLENVKAYPYSKNSSNATEALQDYLKKYFSNQDNISNLSGAYVKQGTYFKIETFNTYYALNNSQYEARLGQGEKAYNVNLYKENAKGEIEADERSHAILLRDKANTKNYGDEATNYKNAPSGMLSFRVTSDASKLDVKVGDKPDTGIWNSLQWSNYAFNGNLSTNGKPMGAPTGVDEPSQVESNDKYKYSYILPTNNSQKLSLTYVPLPENGSIVEEITLKFYPYEKTFKTYEEDEVENRYYYYTLASTPSKSYTIYKNEETAVIKGQEYTFELILGTDNYPVAGKYVFERTYNNSDVNSKIGKFDYLKRTISLVVDPYNVISEIEKIDGEIEGEDGEKKTTTSLESIVGGDILISMYSDNNELEISFPRYINGLNQGSFYTQSNFSDNEAFRDELISISGNKLPLSLLIPQHKYTISSRKSDSTYNVESNNLLSSYSNAEIRATDFGTYEVYLEGIKYAEFDRRDSAEELLRNAQITEYQLYAKIEYTNSNENVTEIYHGGNYSAIIGSSNLNAFTSNGYMNFYKQVSSGSGQATLENTPTNQFNKPGTYVVTIYQANNLGSSSSHNLYSLYKFGFKVEDNAPEFDIVNSEGYSLEESYREGQISVYHTNSPILDIQWQEPKSDYIARIDEKKISVKLNGTDYTEVSQITGTGTKTMRINAESILETMINSNNTQPQYIDITMQFEGHDESLYKTTTKRIYFDISAPSENLLYLMNNVATSSKLQGANASLNMELLHSQAREYYNFKGEQIDFDKNKVSYSYAKTLGAMKYYYFNVNSDFTNTLISAINSGNRFDTQYVGFRQIEDLNSYTQADKTSFNLSAYTQIDATSQEFETGLYEIVERDYAGNMTVYLINVVNSNPNIPVVKYRNSILSDEVTFYNEEMENDNNLYSNTGFEITEIGYNSDSWELFSVTKAGGRAEVYMLSPWLSEGEAYLVKGSSFETVSLASIFNGVTSSNLKHQIIFANRHNATCSNLFVTIYNANLITSTSYDDANAQAVLNINIPTSLSSTTYGYVYPVKIEVQMLDGQSGQYKTLATATSTKDLYGAWEIIGTNNTAVTVQTENGMFTLRTTITKQGAKLKYIITDNFNNKLNIVQLANIASYNEITSDGIVYEGIESDNSVTYVSDKNITFNYHTDLYTVTIEGTETDYTTSTLNKITSTTFSKINNCWTIKIYDSVAKDLNTETPLRTIHVRLYDKLPKWTSDRTKVATENGVVLLDKNLNSFKEDSIQSKVLNQTIEIAGKTYVNPSISYISTYSPVVTMEYKNSASQVGDSSFYKREYPYSAYISRDGGSTFTRIDTQDGAISKYVLRGAGDYLVFFVYDDETILTGSYEAFMITVWDSTASYYSITIDGVKVERGSLTYTSNSGVTYEVNYLIGVDYSNKNRVIITKNEELGVTISSPVTETTGTNVVVELYTYSCSESSGSFALIYIKPNNEFASLLSYESSSGGSETLLNKSSETIVAKETDSAFNKLQITFTPYYGIKSNKVILKVEKMFNGEFVDVSPIANYTDTYATAYITRAGYYRISLHDSCQPANYQTFKGNNYMYLYFLSSVPFVVTSTDEDGNVQTTEVIQNAIYNSDVTLSLTNLSSYYAPSGYPKITVYRNGVVYDKASGSKRGYTERNYTYTFSEPGYYQVDFSAKSTKEVQIRNESYFFTIISKNESRSAFELPQYGSYYVSKIEKIGLGDITDDFIKFGSYKNTITKDGKTYLTSLSLNYLDEKTGEGRYRITVCPNEPTFESVGVKEFSFTLWINKAIPPIEVSVKEGEATTKNITIRFNVANFYETVGDCYIKIGSNIRYYTSETISSLDEVETITISNTGTYYIQVFTESGQLIYSYKVIKNEPLNAFAVIMIIVGIAALGTIIGITVKLRKRQKVK